MEQVLMFFASVVFVMFFIWVGFKLALLRWNYKENSQKLENFEILNKQLMDVNAQQVASIEANNATIKKNTDWYITQLRSIATYISEKHNDPFLTKTINSMLGDTTQTFKEEKKYEIDKILDKISIRGISALTEEELAFLKKHNNKDEK